MNEDRCVCCGEIVPEGTQVCTRCVKTEMSEENKEMTKVYCADDSCEFCNEEGVCTQKEIGLAWMGVNTVFQGYQYFNRCRMYQKSEESKRIEEFTKNLASRKSEKTSGGG